MGRVDPDCELEGRDKSSSGEVESDDKPILCIGNKCLSGGDS